MVIWNPLISYTTSLSRPDSHTSESITLRKIKGEKKTKIAALLLCFVLVGVASAQLLSNMLTFTLIVEEPAWLLEWGTPGQPTDMQTIDIQDFQLLISTGEPTPLYGSFIFVITSLPGGVLASSVSIDCKTVVTSEFDVGWHSFNDMNNSLVVPFNIATTGVYDFSLLCQYAGSYSFSIQLDGSYYW